MFEQLFSFWKNTYVSLESHGPSGQAHQYLHKSNYSNSTRCRHGEQRSCVAIQLNNIFVIYALNTHQFLSYCELQLPLFLLCNFYSGWPRNCVARHDGVRLGWSNLICVDTDGFDRRMRVCELTA